MPNISAALDVLELIQKSDQEFFARKLETTAATFCALCKTNTFTGLYPFWHRFARNLCEECKPDYKRLLIALDAFDKF